MYVWRYFTKKELWSPDTRACDMHEPFMIRLDMVRELYGKSMFPTSGFRSKEHNRRVGGEQFSAHLFGCAADIACASLDKYKLAEIAFKVGMTGIGIYKGFIHLDYIVGADVPGELIAARPSIF